VRAYLLGALGGCLGRKERPGVKSIRVVQMSAWIARQEHASLASLIVFLDSLPYFKTRSVRGSLNVHQEIDFDKVVQIAYTVRYSA
jgi:hypothetical protein